MMKTYNLLLFVAVLSLASACRKDTPDLYNPNEEKLLNTPSQIFTSFWHGMNNGYAFWDIDPTDWDKVYDEYLPRFKALDRQKEVSTYELQMIYTEMTKDLIDGHLVITIKNNRAHKDSLQEVFVSPLSNRITTRDYYHSNYMTIDELNVPIRRNVETGRITSLTGGESVSNPADGSKMTSFSYNIDNGVAYIYLSAFGLNDIFLNSPSPENEQVVKAVWNFQEMVLDMPDLKGVIVDVRSNGGGYLDDMQAILAPMLDEKLHVGYTKMKNGTGRLDYTAWIPAVVSPAPEHRKVEVPIVAITDLYSGSMSEMISMAILELPNGYMVGERTSGGVGILNDFYDTSYAGRFLNKAVDVYMASLITKRVDGTSIESVGVTPDIEVLYDRQSMLDGVDRQLERALRLIKEKSGGN